MLRAFAEIDVFTSVRYLGNPVAVVLDGEDLSTEEMQHFANWTNFSETTFVLPPTEPTADYLVRIFTTTVELPFAGHPTIGTCTAWLTNGGQPQNPKRIVQQCGVGLVPITRNDDGRLAFAAPKLRREGPIDDAVSRKQWRRWGYRPRPSSTLGGSTTDQDGWGSCWARPRRCWRSSRRTRP